MTTTRDRFKRVIEAALVASGSAALVRQRRSESVLVLAYHDIVPTASVDVGDRSLHLQQHVFAEQLDFLRDSHEVIALSDAVDAMPRASHGSDRPRVIITFDDAYSGALTAGLEELRARALPATVFVTPSFLDGGSFWWDVFSDPVTGLNATLRHQALTSGRGLNAEVEIIAKNNALQKHTMPAFARGASMKQLRTALEYERITVAAHTWSHPNLVALPDSMLATELTRPLEWLRQFDGRALPMISYPYGLSDTRVQNAARKAGYTAGFMISGGWSSAPPRDPFAIPRLNVPAGVSRDGFVLRAAGLIQS